MFAPTVIVIRNRQWHVNQSNKTSIPEGVNPLKTDSEELSEYM